LKKAPGREPSEPDAAHTGKPGFCKGPGQRCDVKKAADKRGLGRGAKDNFVVDHRHVTPSTACWKLRVVRKFFGRI